MIAQRFGSSLNYGFFLSVFFLYLTRELEVPASLTGWYFGMLLFSNQILALPARALGQRLGTGRMMTAGSGLELLGYALLFLLPSAGAAFASCILLGAGGALFSTNARVELLYPSDGNTRQAGLQQSSFLRWTNVGALLGPLLALAVWRWAGTRDGFLICLVVELCLTALLLMRQLAARDEPPKPMRLPRRPPPLGFFRQSAVAALPATLAASAPFVVAYLFSDLREKPDDVAIAQFVRTMVIVLLQGWAIRYFARVRNFSACSLLLFFTLALGACLGLAGSYLTTAWLVVALFGFVQVGASSLASGMVIAKASDAAEDDLFGWVKMVMAIASLVMMPIFANLMTAFSAILPQAGQMQQELQLVSALLAVSGLIFLAYIVNAGCLRERRCAPPPTIGRRP